MDLEAILREAGAEIVGLCGTVAEALAVVRSKALSVAVLDVRIRGETIAPVARQLGRHGIPFLFYTGQTKNDPALAEWPGSRVVSKPAQSKTIVGAVADMLYGKARWA